MKFTVNTYFYLIIKYRKKKHFDHWVKTYKSCCAFITYARLYCNRAEPKFAFIKSSSCWSLENHLETFHDF